MKVILYALLASVATAFAPQSSVRPTTHLNENFGLGIGEDSYENQVDLLAGEANYKQWVNRVNENNMLNRKVSNFSLFFCFSAVYPHISMTLFYYFF